MFLVLKRFPMDDVPIALVDTQGVAMCCIYADMTTDKYATPEQQTLMSCGIGLPYCDVYMVVEFDSIGRPINSKIINTED